MYKTYFNPECYDRHTCMSFKNRKEHDAFCAYLDSVGKRWVTGERYTEHNHFDRYHEMTVYYFNAGTYGHLNNVRKEAEILNFADFYYNKDDTPLETELDITFDQLFD